MAPEVTTAPAELSVLVIEDDSQLLRTLRDILGRRGYHPLTANSARETWTPGVSGRRAS
jgi:ActR/RegA family two-component response regulator